jgi:uncharacterized membrane protein
MKKIIIASLAMTYAIGIFGQGTVNFGNRVSGTLVTYIYGPNFAGTLPSQIGNGINDLPAGTTDWTGYTKLSGSGYYAALMSAPGANAADGALQFCPTTTTFRTGTGAGVLASVTATLPNVAKDAAVATIQVFAWDNTSGFYASPSAAWTGWMNGTIYGGVSGKFNVSAIGGDSNVPPNLLGLQSFSFWHIPEPTTMALAGLGSAALLIFRRRK